MAVEVLQNGIIIRHHSEPTRIFSMPMEEIDFSYMQRASDNDQLLTRVLEDFQASTAVQTHLQALEWGKGRAELIKAALYHHGADVSEVGSTWVSDLVAMNALRPFAPNEVETFGPHGSFFPTAWSTTHAPDDPQVWSIPWLVESYVLHYRKDMLKAAGIDEKTAFQSLEALAETVQALKKVGHTLPIALPNRNLLQINLHIAASWVWQAGGDFISRDGRRVLFTEPPALAGFQSYFRLLKSIPSEGLKTLDTHGVQTCFLRGYTPITITGPWFNPRNVPLGDLDKENWGITRLPGPPFVGGTHLVIWKHTRVEKAALALIRYLTGIKESSRYGDMTGILSARQGALASSRYAHDRYMQVMDASIREGRSFPNIALWGLVEDRLIAVMMNLWNTLVENPDSDLDEVVSQSLNQVARNLNITLSQR